MIQLSKEILDKMEYLDEMTPDQMQDLEDNFLESVRDKNNPMYSSVLSSMNDEFLLNMLRMVVPNLKSQVKNNKEDE